MYQRCHEMAILFLMVEEKAWAKYRVPNLGFLGLGPNPKTPNPAFPQEQPIQWQRPTLHCWCSAIGVGTSVFTSLLRGARVRERKDTFKAIGVEF